MRPTILIVKPDHLGDFALALPALWEVHQNLAPSRFTVLASGANHQWSEILPWLPEIISIPHPRYARGENSPPHFLAIAQALKIATTLGPFSFGVELTASRHDFLGKALLIAANCRHRRGLRGHYDWLLHEKAPLGHGHQTARMAQRFSPAWGINGNTPPSRFIPDALQWRQTQAAPLLFFPWVGTAAKEWPLDHWQALWKKLAPLSRTLLVPEPLREKAQALLTQWGEPESAMMITTSIRETLQTLQASRALITLDTGIAHYAWLTGTPLFQLFAGTGDPNRWKSLGASHLFHQPPSCAPCGSEICHRPTHECMLGIQPEAVAKIIREQIESN